MDSLKHHNRNDRATELQSTVFSTEFQYHMSGKTLQLAVNLHDSDRCSRRILTGRFIHVRSGTMANGNVILLRMWELFFIKKKKIGCNQLVVSSTCDLTAFFFIDAIHHVTECFYDAQLFRPGLGDSLQIVFEDAGDGAASGQQEQLVKERQMIFSLVE